MPALLSAIIFFLFAGIVANPAPVPPGKDFIPGLGPGGRIDCIPADASSGTATLFNIPKPSKDNVPFVDQPNRFYSCAGKGNGCDINPWNGEPIPEVADYVTIAQNVLLTKIWPDNDTTRLAKQILPQSGEPNYNPSFDNNEFRDRIYRPTCNDWCYFKPPKRSPSLPYGGTFFCEFIFLYQGQNIANKTDKRRLIEDGPMAGYPDDTNCDADSLEDCPVFDILIRKDAAVPEIAGGAAPGSSVTPIRCDIKNQNPSPTTTSQKQEFFASFWIEAVNDYIGTTKANAQTETFINLVGDHDAKGRWLYNTKKITYTSKMLDEDGGRVKIPEPNPIVFRGVSYEAYFNLIKSIKQNKKVLYLAEVGVVEEADNKRQITPDFEVSYLEFRRSPDIRPGGKTLQFGTFDVTTARGWWELFPEESKPAIYLYPKKSLALNVKLKTSGKLTVSDPPYDPKLGWNVVAYPNGTLKTPSVLRSESLGVEKSATYPYLYYEAILDRVHIKPTGFLVPGSELEDFFHKTLPKLGLNERETTDFIDYWMSRLDSTQPFYFIHFLSEDQIEQLEPLVLERLLASKEDKDSEEDNFSEESVVRASPLLKSWLRSISRSVENYLTRYIGGRKGELTSEEKFVFKKSLSLKPDTQIRIRPYFKPLSAQEANSLNIKPQSLPTPPDRKGFVLVEWGGILVD